MSDRRFRLVTLGGLRLLTAHGTLEPSLGNKTRKLALLAVLALEQRPLKRDRLAELFWGDRDDERAKHSLSDALSHIRHVLGARAVVVDGGDVALAPGAPLNVDAVDLLRAKASGDAACILELYRGPFLADVFVADAASFEHWADAQRVRIQRVFLAACEHQCTILCAAGGWEECVDVAERWLQEDPSSYVGARVLLDAGAAAGPEASARALVTFDAICRQLREDFDLEPQADLLQRAHAMRRAAAAAAAPAATAASPPRATGAGVTMGTSTDTVVVASAPASGAPAAPVSGRPTAGRRWTFAALGVVALAIAATPIAEREILRYRSRTQAVPALVLTRFTRAHADSADEWLDEGVPRLIAARLFRSPSVEIVVADALVRGPRKGERPRPLDTLGIARGLSARWVVGGSVMRTDSLVELEITIRDVASGDVVRRFGIARSQLLDATTAAAVQLLEFADAEEQGASFGDVETSSVEAYEHYVHALKASADGRFHESDAELDAAIALDSGFVTAVRQRMVGAVRNVDWRTAMRLDSLIHRYGTRLTEWDRLEMQLLEAFHAGDRGRSDALARLLVRRFSRDPRAYSVAVNVLESHGRWGEADSLLGRAIALDSVVEVNGGDCAPCSARGDRIVLRAAVGDFPGARRLAMQEATRDPVRPGAWLLLARVDAQAGDIDAALAAALRAHSLSAGDPEYDELVAEILLMARRLDAADSVASAMLRRGDRWNRALALEIRVAVERERGEYRRSAATARRLAADSMFADALLVEANSLARAGRTVETRQIYESIPSHPRQWNRTRPAFIASTADAARYFTWHHALEADALGAQCDTAWLTAMADSLAWLGSRSYFGRDWSLHHHVRGLVAMCTGQPGTAAREFQAALWTATDWSETLAWLARARLAQHDPRAAIVALRRAYRSLPDGMGRYLPQTEIDLLMAQAHLAAGQRDSARAYASHVQRAWRDPDPSARVRLAALLRALR